MQAVLFPATYISETFFEAVKSCFQQVILYQPTRRLVPPRLQMLAQKGWIELRIPVDSDEKKLETLVSGYRNWAALHEGGALEYLKLQQRSVPFFEDTSISKIRTDIRQAAAETQSAFPAPGPLFNARVFLQIAQEYDLQAEEIARKLAEAHETERKLFKELSGESDSGAERTSSTAAIEPDSSGRMMEIRIRAWTQLFLQDSPLAAADAVFVTVHRTASEFMLEQTPAAEEILQIRSIPVMESFSQTHAAWQDQFGRTLGSLTEEAGASAQELIAQLRAKVSAKTAAGLKLYRIPGELPASFFARCAGRAPRQEAPTGRPEPENRTLLALVEIEAGK